MFFCDFFAVVSFHFISPAASESFSGNKSDPFLDFLICIEDCFSKSDINRTN